MFEPKLDIKVNMTGKEYLEYKKFKKIKLTKNQKQAIIIFSACMIGIFFIIFLIEDLTYKPPTNGFISSWYESAIHIKHSSWNDIGKITFLFFAPFLVIVIGLSWLIHGFGFLIFKG